MIIIFMVLELGSFGRVFLLNFPAQSRQQVSVGIAMNAMFIVILFFLVLLHQYPKKSFLLRPHICHFSPQMYFWAHFFST